MPTIINSNIETTNVAKLKISIYYKARKSKTCFSKIAQTTWTVIQISVLKYMQPGEVYYFPVNVYWTLPHRQHAAIKKHPQQNQ